MWYFILGVSSALDTLGSQAYGANDRSAPSTCLLSRMLMYFPLILTLQNKILELCMDRDGKAYIDQIPLCEA